MVSVIDPAGNKNINHVTTRATVEPPNRPCSHSDAPPSVSIINSTVRSSALENTSRGVQTRDDQHLKVGDRWAVFSEMASGTSQSNSAEATPGEAPQADSIGQSGKMRR